MKRILVSAILGLAALTSIQAQSYIQLYSYGTLCDIGTGGNHIGNVTYGDLNGAAVTGGYTVGFYWAAGNVVSSVNAIIGGATGASNPANTLVGSGVNLATGPNGTAPIGVDGPGLYDNGSVYIIDPSLSAVSQTITVVLVAYTGSSYESSPSIQRGHSAAFTMPTAAGGAFATLTGNYAGAFAIPLPEPSTFALVGLGLASLLIFRRRK